MHTVHRMLDQPQTNPIDGIVRWSPLKSLWFTACTMIAIVGGAFTFSPSAVIASFILTVTTLCLGHSVGFHRLLIHRSFECPRWLEYILIHLGVVVGMGGPFRVMYMHEIRDWAQRHPHCHSFFIHRNPIWKDFLWQLHCDIHLQHPPEFRIERSVSENRLYRLMQRTWPLQQLPWALLLYALGGPAWVVWGIFVRITVSLIGHWLIGYFAHNQGSRDWHLTGHAVQGYNLNHLGMLTMGECWHNNHHAFPGSARLGLGEKQIDPGWWAIRTLQKLGLVWAIKLPADLPDRPELSALHVKTGA
jgi:fatty-acid desaturase